MLANLVGEALGTTIFLSCILAWGDPIPIVIGLLAAIYAFGKVSGGHFNPAVSFLMLLKGDVSGAKFFAYVAAQLIGAVLALIWWKHTLGSKKQ